MSISIIKCGSFAYISLASLPQLMFGCFRVSSFLWFPRTHLAYIWEESKMSLFWICPVLWAACTCCTAVKSAHLPCMFKFSSFSRLFIYHSPFAMSLYWHDTKGFMSTWHQKERDSVMLLDKDFFFFFGGFFQLRWRSHSKGLSKINSFASAGTLFEDVPWHWNPIWVWKKYRRMFIKC